MGRRVPLVCSGRRCAKGGRGRPRDARRGGALVRPVRRGDRHPGACRSRLSTARRPRRRGARGLALRGRAARAREPERRDRLCAARAHAARAGRRAGRARLPRVVLGARRDGAWRLRDRPPAPRDGERDRAPAARRRRGSAQQARSRAHHDDRGPVRRRASAGRRGGRAGDERGARPQRFRDHLLRYDLGVSQPRRLPARRRVDRGVDALVRARGGERLPWSLSRASRGDPAHARRPRFGGARGCGRGRGAHRGQPADGGLRLAGAGRRAAPARRPERSGGGVSRDHLLRCGSAAWACTTAPLRRESRGSAARARALPGERRVRGADQQATPAAGVDDDPARVRRGGRGVRGGRRTPRPRGDPRHAVHGRRGSVRPRRGRVRRGPPRGRARAAGPCLADLVRQRSAVRGGTSACPARRRTARHG